MPNYKIDDVDFFAEANLTEAARTDTVAYLIDKEPACTTLEQGPYRQVTIKNPLGLSYQFVPIDHNIVIYRDNGEMASTCDGMLHYGGRKNVFFVELKESPQHLGKEKGLCGQSPALGLPKQLLP